MVRWVERALARRGAWLVGLILVTGLALTAWLAESAQRQAEDRLTHRFDAHVDRLEQEIISRIQRAEFGLRGTRAALAVKPDVTREEFKAIVESRDIWREFRGVRGFGFIERVDRQALPAFEAAQRAGGAGGFTVRTSGRAAAQGRGAGRRGGLAPDAAGQVLQAGAAGWHLRIRHAGQGREHPP